MYMHVIQHDFLKIGKTNTRSVAILFHYTSQFCMAGYSKIKGLWPFTGFCCQSREWWHFNCATPAETNKRFVVIP